MKTSELSFHLPPELIAQSPASHRSDARLLVLHRSTGTLEHTRFSDLPRFLDPGDCLALNETRVIPARFFLRRATGGRIEGLFLHQDQNNRWRALLKNASRLQPRETLTFDSPPGALTASQTMIVIEKCSDGQWLLQPDPPAHAHVLLQEAGFTPLPPYIRRKHITPDSEQFDRQRYQTVFSRHHGSVAAPTAGLHFTDQLLHTLTEQGVHLARLTLHVGLGTFKPVTAADLEDHHMHAEPYQLDPDQADIINRAHAQGRKLVAVGTTTVRTLETLADHDRVNPGQGSTDLMILPGYRFRIIDALITNFHLPETTLLALVCAFAGKDLVLHAYQQAVQHRYRFYSYGDAMLIL